ncbi:MAG: hypothetical protein QOF58_6577 [Pseudonocardiales bacterium]|jgi:predicted transcriptional regulator|nr:hypothetical protein [Pseudonocardiales bacterium]
MADQVITKGKRILGAARRAVGEDLRAKYEKGASIRALAEDIGRSYGFVHRVLGETGVALRSRGGDVRPTNQARPRRRREAR